jgi:cyclophilin family peptidyl-prolyl cis-trans isomerase
MLVSTTFNRRAWLRLAPTLTNRHFASRGAKGWGWYHRAKEDETKEKPASVEFPQNVRSDNPRPKVFLKLSGLEETDGRMVFELANDIVPTTCKNFYDLCTGVETESGGATVSYRGTKFHQILRDAVAVGGDIDESGGKSSFSKEMTGDPRGYFPNENYAVHHTQPGILSMVPNGVDCNASQFLITLGADNEHLNGRHVAFGHLVEGHDVLKSLNDVFAAHGKPLADIVVEDCGSI